MKILSSVCLILLGSLCCAQPLLVDLDYDKIPQRKVRSFIHEQIENSKVFFTDMEASCSKNSDTSGYNYLEHVFHIEEDISNVWEAYKNSSMARAWNSRSVSFGVLFNKYNEDVLYQDQPDLITGVDTGQVFFLNLKICRGIYNLAVGMEIIDVDSSSNTIQFSYIKGGKSEGAQRITFIEEEDGSTKIVHSSIFRSHSKFRDRRLYPFFHDKLITEFHENILKNIIVEPHAFVLLDKHYLRN